MPRAPELRMPGKIMRPLEFRTLILSSLILVGPLCHNTVPLEEMARNLNDLSVEEIRDRMELYIQGKAGTEQIPGAAAALFKQGTPMLWVHKGLSERDRVSIASLTKPFTAMIVLRLARQGKLDIDQSIVEYLPELKDRKEPKEHKKVALLQHVTVRMLLSHRSGMPYRPAGDERSFQVQEKKFPLPIKEKLGSYDYSNYNYHLLALLVERVSGQRLSVLTEQWILKPAGMKNTSAAGSNGAAGMVSTLEDLTRFCEFLLAENKREASPYYRVFELFGNAQHRKKSSEYGLGWHLFSASDGSDVFYHSGTWYKSAAEIYILPASSSYFVHIANPPNFQDKETIRYRSDIIKMGRLALIRPD